MDVERALSCNLKRIRVLWVITVFFFMFSPKVALPKESYFRQPCDTLPIREKTILEMTLEAEQGYILKNDAGKTLKAKLDIEDVLRRVKENCDVNYSKYSVTRSFNVSDLEYSIDKNQKKEGLGSLNIKFKRGDIIYCGEVYVKVFFPAFDARGSKISLWIRSDNSEGRGIHISLLDDIERVCERWAFYNQTIKSGNWHLYEITPGYKSGARDHIPDSNCPGDITNIHSVKIALYGYSEETAASYNIDAIELIPPEQIFFKSVMKLQGLCSLRPEGQTNGVTARWFDPQMDDSDWKKVPIVQFWNKKENDPIAWYRIPFHLSKGAIDEIKAKQVFIVFAGVDESAWVWLNGEKIGAHSENSLLGWDQPFAFDITGKLKLDAENLLAVKVLNRQEAGGIWQPILIVTEK